jgi:fatty-acyl-CoA synthase
LSFSEEDVIVSWLPLYHDMGLIAGFLLPVLTGVPLVLMSPFDWVRAPQRLLQAVSAYRRHAVWLPNFAYNFCVQKIRDRHLEGVDLSSWRLVINCSEPVRADSHRRFYERFRAYGLRQEALAVSYAMAENVFAVTQTPPGRSHDRSCDRDLFQRERVAQPAVDGACVGSGFVRPAHRGYDGARAWSAAGKRCPNGRKANWRCSQTAC